MTLEQQLQELAASGGGRTTIRPREGQDLEAFKVTVATLQRYRSEGRLKIIGEPHQESYSGQRSAVC